jgi:hypothetical protein
MKRLCLFFLVAAFVATAADGSRGLRASFPDGTGVEIRTETTGSSPIDPVGQMGIGPGAGSRDMVNRVVLDRANHILFGYHLEASRGVSPGTVRIRIAPLSAETEDGILRRAHGPRPVGPTTPTVAGVREFPDVRFGQAVTLDILYNPSTGEKIFDVLRPVPASEKGMAVSSEPASQTISLKDVTITVDGRRIPAPASFLIGAAVRVDLPGLGTYVLAAADPNQPGFAAAAQADGKTLSWSSGRHRIEITSATGILTGSEKGTPWLYFDPHYRPDVVGLQSADTVDWLLPKR